jgi:hypothetical protein
MKIGLALATLILVACSAVAISDRYGNEYGDWYNPGGDYRWQLDLCERQIADVPLAGRKLAMRCCMHAHGVPVGDSRDCRT